MEETLTELRHWVWAVAKHFGLVIGGTISGVVGWIVAEYLPNGALPAKAFYALAIYCAVNASFLAWREEHREKNALKAQVQTGKPQIHISIEQTRATHVGTTTSFLLDVSIDNAGAQSSVTKYSMSLQKADGSVVGPFGPTLYASGYQVDLDGHTVTYAQEHLISERTLDPIPTGGTKSGVIVFDVPNQGLLEVGDAVVLTARDVLGTMCEARHEWTGVMTERKFLAGAAGHITPKSTGS